jgi:4-hydroxythreonine-4-phosphate dehydrogenase
MGDPAGIGPEVVVKALARVRAGSFLLIGSRDVFESEQRRQGLSVLAKTAVVDPAGGTGRFVTGKVQRQCGEAAYACLQKGVELLNEGEISGLVTGPVSKEALRLAGFRWPGQTEFLAESLGSSSFAMLAWTPKFKAVFVTIHMPLGQVGRHITPELVAEKTVLLDRFLRLEGKQKPRIAVMALNPHGDEFSLGEEDRIRDGIRLASRAGVNAEGPVPADAAVAGPAAYDGFVAMYHDQAMIPAKLLGRDAGVNVTLGLGRVRTSPLHGVAFDIAGQGRASEASTLAAIRLARRLAGRQSS